MSGFKQARWVVGISATLCLVAGTGWSLRGHEGGESVALAEDAKVEAVPVTAVEAKAQDLPKVIAGIGLVSPLQSVTVRSRVDGEVTAVSFTEGDVVQKGAVLVQIDARQLESSLTGAEAKRTQDSALLGNAQADRDRYKTLAEKNIVSASSFDQKNAEVAQLEAAVKSDDASIASARTQLGYATVRAPITGRTGFRQVDLGALVNAGSATGIVTITQLQPIGVTFVAPGDRFGEIREAMKADVATVEAMSTDGTRVLARGKLTLMDNQVDSANGSIKLRATFDNEDGALWPGLPVATRLIVAVNKGVVVPDKALARGESGLYAYVVGSDNKAKIVQVSTDYVTDAQALVSKGLSAGDRVVMDGRSRLGDGAAVQVSEWHGAPSGALADKE